MTALRVAVVGAGRFGREHIRAYSRMADVQLVGIADIDLALADRVSQDYDIPAVDSATELVSAVHPDAISVAVPAPARDMVIDTVCRSGAAVLIEKPLAADGVRARQIADVWHSRPVMTGHLVRFADPYRAFRDACRSCRRPLQGYLSRTRSPDHLVDYPSEDVIGLTMIHDLDVAIWLVGRRPQRVRADGDRADDGRWRRTSAHIDFVDGSSIAVEAAWSGDPIDVAELGDARLVVAPDRSTLVRGGDEVVDGAGSATVYDAALRAELRHFVQCALAGTPSSLLSLRDAATAVVLADAIRSSLARSGRWIELR